MEGEVILESRANGIPTNKLPGHPTRGHAMTPQNTYVTRHVASAINLIIFFKGTRRRDTGGTRKRLKLQIFQLLGGKCVSIQIS